jgi:outer membrane receptor for ferrienterochelin and colicin
MAWAQPQEPGAPITYDATFFAPFAPQTALDMVRRVPGFAISEGEERRGFAGAAGNVLIDGAQPAVKSEDIEDILERIPARDVVRIELIRGEGANASSAQAVRVNVVRLPSDGAGVWEASLEQAADGPISPAGQVSWSGRRGAVEYGLAAAFEESHAPIDGEELGFDAAGVLEQRDLERIMEDERERRLSGELTTPFAQGALALNLSLSSEDGHDEQSTSSFTAGGVDNGRERVDAREREDIGEIGASYTRVAGAWSGDLAVLITRRQLVETESSEEFGPGGAFDEAEREARDVESGETILRGGAERAFSENAHMSFGAEVALNTLDQTLSLTEDDGGGPSPVDVPGANVSIEEWRAEAFVTYAWRAGPWRLEASGAVETSRLTQSGDAELETHLTYWKPSFQAVRPIGPDDQLRFRLYRDVGQLDFEDFAASAELSAGDVFAGNANLRPETSWRLEAAGDWRFEHGALDLTLYYWRIEDALDFVPVGTPPDLFDARGNIGDAELWGVRTAFELPIPLLESARLRVEGVWQESEVTDLLTGETRPQSEIQESFLSAEFRHDLSRLDLAWGVDFEREREAPEFRLDRVTREKDADSVELWIETTRFEGLKLRLFVENLTRSRETRDRRSFDPDRTGAFEGRERREREPGRLLGVELRGEF